MHYTEVDIATRRGQRALLLAVVVLGLAPATLPAQSRGTEAWRIIQPPQSSQILARDGSLIAEVGAELRTSISLRTLPRYVPQAFIAVEDRRFYQHDGVDVIGIAGAIKGRILGEQRGGASTITQQLVGNMHPDLVDRREQTLARKLREQQAAREMEKRYTKAQILEAYLNQINFAHGWYGIETAARHYFGKSATQLSLAEAATLAAMPKAPENYEPVKFPERARERRNTVLALMQQQGYITRAQAQAAQASRVVTVPNYGVSIAAPYFIDVVKVQARRAGVPIANGGYRVYTTLDPVLQHAAALSLTEGTREVEARSGYRHAAMGSGNGSDYLQGLVVAIDPATGDVRALVGGRDYRTSQFDRAVDGMRQPGSSFKPIVYAAAIAGSIAANAIVGDTAIAIPLPNGTVYRPDNSDHEYLGEITLREALTKSRNVVAVQLGQTLGMDSVIALARRMGITSPIAPYPSSAIGASAVQPLDLVAAYTTFANLGTPVEPRFINRIEDRSGKTLLSPPVRTLAPALDQGTAFVVRDMMRDVVERGTATSIRRYLPASIPVAGKTGTTNDNTDVWFVGLTPDIVAGVWLGFDKPKTITAGAAGGSLAAPIWGKMMSRYYALTRRPADSWTIPPGVTAGELDRVTGELANEETPPDRIYTEYFIEGTEPIPLRPELFKIFQSGPIIR
ncbi:MAG: PBP1A family penicillin-binding protein [Gemmatimonadota bacterium]|nr:PBP1A family penicillin-binding protein [Gemmatimonadota bacterium]